MKLKIIKIVKYRSQTIEEKRDRPIILLYFATLIISIFAEYKYSFFDLYLNKAYGFYCGALIGMVMLAILLVVHKMKLSRDDYFLLTYMGGAAFYYLLSATFIGGGFRYVGVVFVAMGTTLIVKRIAISKNLYKKIMLVCMIALAMYARIAAGYFDRQFQTDLTNSNYIGLLVVFLLAFTDYCLEISTKENESILGKVLRATIRLGIIMIVIYIDLECRSRAALISIVFYLICRYVLPDKIFKSRRLVLFALVAILIATIVFPFIYVKYSSVFDVRFMDRSGLNRFKAWSYVTTHLNETLDTFLFGHGTRSSLRKILGYPAHNTFLQTWYDTGFVGIILADLFTILCVKRAIYSVSEISKPQMIALIGLFAIIINDSFGVVFTEALSLWEYSLLGLTMKGITYE